MFSVITNIYNKKTKGPTLMELFTATGKLRKVFFLTTGYVRCVHHGWHGTHRTILCVHHGWHDTHRTILCVHHGWHGTHRKILCVHHGWHGTHRTIFKFLPHTRVNMGASIFFTAAMIRAFRSAKSRGSSTLRTLHEMHVAQWPQIYSRDIPTHKTTSPPERPFFHYIHSHRLAAEMWTTMKNNLLGKKCELFLLSVQVS